MNEASWRALDLLRAYAAGDRAVAGYLVHLKDDQLEFARGVTVNFYNDNLQMLRDTERPYIPTSLVREVDGLAGPLRVGRARVRRHRRRPTAGPGRGDDAEAHRRRVDGGPRPHPHPGRLYARPLLVSFSRK